MYKSLSKRKRRDQIEIITKKRPYYISKKLFNHINMHWADHYANVRIKRCGKFKVSGEFSQ